jgi:hypothetical protein
MSWGVVSVWIGSVWLAFLVGFVAGAAWKGMFRALPEEWTEPAFTDNPNRREAA